MSTCPHIPPVSTYLGSPVFAYLVTTPPVVRTCPRCQRPTLTGLAEGLRAIADPTALDRPQQIQAALLGLQLYWITRTGLVHVDQSRARANHRHPTAPEHRCTLVWPTNTNNPTTPQPTRHTDQPPY